MPDELRARPIVLDTGPLITLAVAESLGYLLCPDLPIIIPDALLFEATWDADRLGATDTLAWVQRESGRVRIVPTEALLNHIKALSHDPKGRSKGMGEQAAMEVIQDATHLAPDERALLLSEDALLDDILPVTTHDFLLTPEAAKRIDLVHEVHRRCRWRPSRQPPSGAARTDDQARAAVQAAMKPRT